MFKVLVMDNSVKDASLFRSLLTEEGAQVEVCRDGAAARQIIEAHADGFTASFLLWNIADLTFAETLALLRHRWPETPVVVMFEEFTSELAVRAFRLGAKDVLQKPVEAERIKACLRELLSAQDADSPMMAELRKTIRGESASLLAALRQLTKVIPHADARVLILGESGSGKEMFARAIHQLGKRAGAPLVAVQISAINEHLIESELFGHEKGAFTGADGQHIGFFEQAGAGTLFLDEIGDLSASAQIKLLRVIQEKKFRRLKGKVDLPFKARLVCATHRNLAEEVSRNNFRLDLFQRINGMTIHVPPLRDRKGDVEKLAACFLDARKGERQVVFADETLKILHSYPFPGNVRELENVVTSALSVCAGEVIMPQHLPMRIMNDLLSDPPTAKSAEAHAVAAQQHAVELMDELSRLLPADWLTSAYRKASKPYIQAFDRVYLRRMLDRHRYNVTAAARAANLDPKTFRKLWKQAELPPLVGEEEKTDE
ncbi:MAG: sigma-54-dependent transcriptional regulator [Blastocatellales bacterium]